MSFANLEAEVEIRSVSREESEAFGQPFTDVNWGVLVNGELLALYQADAEDDGTLCVHANVKRRQVHPAVTALIAKRFCDRLLELGATALKAEINPSNIAAIRMAKAAGLVEYSRNDDWVTLMRLSDGEGKIAADAI